MYIIKIKEKNNLGPNYDSTAPSWKLNYAIKHKDRINQNQTEFHWYRVIK